MKHHPRKRFGQHFLHDVAIIDALVRAIAPRPGQRMVEIGPGLAALTQPLLERLGQLTVIELDRDLAARLRNNPQLHVIEADVLTVNFAQLASSHTIRVVGNLPYNISTPILFHLLDYAQHIEDQHFMLQKEVVDRITAAPATAAYGRLSVMLQWRYAMEKILDVPAASFSPLSLTTLPSTRTPPPSTNLPASLLEGASPACLSNAPIPNGAPLNATSSITSGTPPLLRNSKSAWAASAAVAL